MRDSDMPGQKRGNLYFVIYFLHVRVEIELAVMLYNIYMSVDVETTSIVVGNTEERGVLAQFRLFSVFLNS